jgi:hypothetical protein
MREDERGKKGGCDGNGVPFISERSGVGDGLQAAPRGGEGWGGARGQRGGQAVRRGLAAVLACGA